MPQKTIKFTPEGVKSLPVNKPVVYKIQTKTGITNYVGITKRGRVQERLLEHLAEGKIPGDKVLVEQMSSVQDARNKEQNIISRSQPEYNTQGK